MLLTDTGHELIGHLERQRDVPSLLGSFQKLVKAFGLTAFCVGNPAQARRWEGFWPAGWEEHYSRARFFSKDPTVTRMKASPLPFRWSDNYAGLDASQQRMVGEMRELGMGDGLAIPIHGPGGVIAGISIAAATYELSPDDEYALYMASLYLHARLTWLRPHKPARLTRKLAPRERECLAWVALGKTDWEISQILHISEQTAHGYVQSALTKLGARSRAQAVALAMQSSQILQ